MAKTKFLILFGIIILSSCSLKKEAYDSIELMSYNYRYIRDGENAPAKLQLRCYRYALIGKSGNANVYNKKNYPKEEISYFKAIINGKLIDSLLIAANRDNHESNEGCSDRKGLMINDGPSLKIKIILRNGMSKSISFIDDLDKGNYYFIELHHYLDSIYKEKNNELVEDTFGFEKKRLEFINYTFKEDTANSKYKLPPPPPPPEALAKVKYKIPEIK